MERRLKRPEGGIFSLGSESVNDSVTVNENNNVNGNVNKFVTISRKPRKRYNVPMTYRLDPVTIDKIAELSERSGMGVSEFLQALLDKVLEQIDIE